MKFKGKNSEWHKWFAWRPVQKGWYQVTWRFDKNTDWVWLETIERRFNQGFWEYRWEGMGTL